MLTKERIFYIFAFITSNSSFISQLLQKLINILAGIRKYWWENFSKINKRTGTTIPDSRVYGMLYNMLKISICR